MPVEEAAPTTPPADDTTTAAPADAPAADGPGTDAPGEDSGMSELESAILEETNRRRTNHGLTPLQPSACAAQFAGEHSTWMALSGSFAHTELVDLRDRCGTLAAAENIATQDFLVAA